MKWACIQPLIGGMALGGEKAFGKKPEYIISSPNIDNDYHLLEYWDYWDKYYYMEDLQNPEPVDIVLGVPICSGLSAMNCATTGSKARGAEATQNQNMYELAKYSLSKIRPKVYLFENAPGLFTKMGTRVREILYNIAKEHGYSILFYKTNTLLHGIPQQRQRTFCFFWKDDTVPILKWYKREKPDLLEYLDKIPKDSLYNDTYSTPNILNEFSYLYILDRLGKDWRTKLYNMGYITVFAYVIKQGLVNDLVQFAEESENQKWIHAAKHIEYKLSINKGIWDSSVRVFHHHYNAVVSKNCFNTFHPLEDRSYSIREYLHLMGHPHDFILYNKNKWLQLTQNVPVHTARDMCLECLSYINGELPKGYQDFIKMDNEKQKILNS